MSKMPKHLLPVETPVEPKPELFLSKNTFNQPELGESLKEGRLTRTAGRSSSFQQKKKNNFRDSQANQKHYFQNESNYCPPSRGMISASQTNTQKEFLRQNYRDILDSPQDL